MHVLKPESIIMTRKNIQKVLTNIQKIFIYIYIYKLHSSEWGDNYAQNKASKMYERMHELMKEQ